jgi:hypothetical protein
MTASASGVWFVTYLEPWRRISAVMARASCRAAGFPTSQAETYGNASANRSAIRCLPESPACDEWSEPSVLCVVNCAMRYTRTAT